MMHSRILAKTSKWFVQALAKVREWVNLPAELPNARPDRNPETTECLKAFLRAMSYRGSDLHRAEAVPHFQEGMDISDLRTALVNLGFVTEPQRMQLSSVDGRVMPCLFESENSRTVTVLLGRMHDGALQAFRRGQYTVLQASDCEEWGTCYFPKPIQAAEQTKGAWSEKLFRRFRVHLAQLLALSFLSNVISIAIPLFVMNIYDRVIAHRALDALPMLLVGVSIAIGFDLYFKSLRSRLMGILAARIDYLIGTQSFRKLMRLPLGLVGGPSISAQIARLKEFHGVRDLFSGPAATAVVDFPFTVMSLLAVAAIGGWLAVVPFGFCVVFALAGYISAKWLQHAEQVQGTSVSNLMEHVTDATLHHESIKREGSEQVWLHRFRLASADAASKIAVTSDRGAVVEAVSQFLNSFAALSVLIAGTLMVLDGYITVGALIATMALTWRILSPSQQLFQTIGRFAKLRGSIRALDQLMRLADEQDMSIPNLARAPRSGKINFTRVNLRYGRDGEPSLININLSVPAGKMIAFTGSNGAGKSSILRVVQGLYPPQSGIVTIDGVDIRQLPAKVLRRSIACAPQRMDMFYGTIEQNLKIADPLATSEVLHASLADVGLLDTVMSMPEGLKTRIGDSATSRLPPSFMRQLTIARALVRQAPILVLDEPESMLDEAGAIAIQNMLEKLRGTRTVLFVSHRPSYIRIADFAVFMRGGMIEYGGKPEGAIDKLLGREAGGKAA